MALLPLLYDILNESEDILPSRGIHNFGLGLYPHELEIPLRRNTLWPGIYTRPLYAVRNSAQPKKENRVAQNTSIGKDGFQVSLDVEHFQPNEISVKTVDNTIVVEGKHEEREDEHGQIYRHFIRRYELPKDINVDEVVSTLSSDGVLTLKAPPKAQAITNEKVIQIQQTGPAHLSVKENPEKDKKDDKME